MKYVLATVVALGLSAPAFAGSVAPAEDDEVVIVPAATGGSLSPGLLVGALGLLLVAAASGSSSGT